jgi:hypothetical protein
MGGYNWENIPIMVFLSSLHPTGDLPSMFCEPGRILIWIRLKAPPPHHHRSALGRLPTSTTCAYPVLSALHSDHSRRLQPELQWHLYSRTKALYMAGLAVFTHESALKGVVCFYSLPYFLRGGMRSTQKVPGAPVRYQASSPIALKLSKKMFLVGSIKA